ncbi:hypothetical protein O6H91_02G000500 [Diphasiastrum complanatum]|uniref:Uncharacterized protein n=1 Tax=Diphasiastrum complanatum TaxID=34168 RepID=A0ACC2ECC4_DIPCM|nr:hypothetical protein O6H91_02G000500 [Diphasiastrum complanatum]
MAQAISQMPGFLSLCEQTELSSLRSSNKGLLSLSNGNGRCSILRQSFCVQVNRLVASGIERKVKNSNRSKASLNAKDMNKLNLVAEYRKGTNAEAGVLDVAEASFIEELESNVGLRNDAATGFTSNGSSRFSTVAPEQNNKNHGSENGGALPGIEVDSVTEAELKENGFRSTRRTKLVCTIGPKTCSFEQLEALAIGGMNVARINMCHGTQEWHREVIRKVRRLNEEKGYSVALMMDTEGSEIHMGDLGGASSVKAEDGEDWIFTVRKFDESTPNHTIQVNYEGFSEGAYFSNTNFYKNSR